MSGLEQMLRNWRASPDPEQTVTLCFYLGTSSNTRLIQQIGAAAERQFGDLPDVMLAVGRMYLKVGLLPEARRALVLAQRGMRDDSRLLRYMGEVLLRQGDAMRAQQVLARAVAIGGPPDAHIWLEQAERYVRLQEQHGASVVASAVQRTLPQRRLPPAAQMHSDSVASTEESASRQGHAAPAPPRPRHAGANHATSSRGPLNLDFGEEELSDVLSALSVAELEQSGNEVEDDDVEEVSESALLKDEPDESVEELSVVEELSLDDDEYQGETIATPVEAELALRSASRSEEPITKPARHLRHATSRNGLALKQSPSRALQAAAPSYPDITEEVTDITDIVSVDGLPEVELEGPASDSISTKASAPARPLLPPRPSPARPAPSAAPPMQRVPQPARSAAPPPVSRLVPSAPPVAPRVFRSAPPAPSAAPRMSHQAPPAPSAAPCALAAVSPAPSLALPVLAIAPPAPSSAPPTRSHPPAPPKSSAPLRPATLRLVTPPPPLQSAKPPEPLAEERQSPRQPADTPPVTAKPVRVLAVEQQSNLVAPDSEALRPQRVPEIAVDTTAADATAERHARARALALPLAEKPKPAFQQKFPAPAVLALRPKSRWRSVWRLLLVMMLFGGGAVTTWQYLEHREQIHQVVRTFQQANEVGELLRRSDPDALKAARNKLAALEQPPSFRGNIARLRMRQAILQLIVDGESVPELDKIVAAATAAGVPAKALAAGHVAVKLAKQDRAGVQSTIREWQAPAAQDPYFHLMAGAALERLGDRAALDHYHQAWQLDSKFAIAAVLMARLALLDQGAVTTRRQVAQIRAALGDRPEAAALLGLVWALDAERSERFPEKAELSGNARKNLPVSLHSAVELTEARRALVVGKMDVAREHVRAALVNPETPFMLAALGVLGLEAQSDALASDAAAQLQQLNLNDATAAVLRARASLMSGRIDESISMIEKIDVKEKPLSSPVQMTLIRAIAAYERLDLQVLRQVLAETEHSDTPIPDLAALADAPRALTGRDLPPVTDLGQKQRWTAVWGDLIAVDIALADGDVRQASTLTDKWTELDDRPLHLLRLAKLRRYEQRYLEAQELCERAANLAPVPPALVIERTLVLLSLNKLRLAEDWLAKNTQLAEPARAWLLALIAAHYKGGRLVAAATLEKLTLPDKNTPLALRLVAARALAIAGDGRGTEFVGELARSIPNNPDIQWALTVMKK